MYAPIALFVFDRPWHTKRTLEALSNNFLAENHVLYVFSDGPKSNSSSEQKIRIDEVRQIIRNKWSFNEIHIYESEANLGLAKSIVNGVTRLVNENGKVIVLEDDIITSVGFLQFMEDSLDFYVDSERVMHVSAYMYPHVKKLPETFFFNVPYPGGGWGTWQRAWKHYIDKTDFLYNRFNTARGWYHFNKVGGDYLQRQLYLNYTGELNTWFIKWHATLLIKNGYTLYPRQSLTNNIGFDNSGSNCHSTSKFDVKILADRIIVSDIPLKESKDAKKLVVRFYQGPRSLKKIVYTGLTYFIKKEQIQKFKYLLKKLV